MNLDAIALAAINDAGGQEHIDSMDDQARAEAINRLARDLAQEHGVSLDVARRAVGKALARERGRAVRSARSGWGGPRPGAGSGGPRPNAGPLPRFLRWAPFGAGEKGATAMSAADITLYRCNGCGAWAWEPYVGGRPRPSARARWRKSTTRASRSSTDLGARWRNPANNQGPAS
ncbi:MAG: hypothetical protein KatS3mg051_2047 [Anaerolineae bacterium]|nr:MAG: hypothetical protein KatS3mg051_2047 [Anaerolineae bacterium]